jgi:hypothetical protein
VRTSESVDLVTSVTGKPNIPTFDPADISPDKCPNLGTQAAVVTIVAVNVAVAVVVVAVAVVIDVVDVVVVVVIVLVVVVVEPQLDFLNVLGK